MSDLFNLPDFAPPAATSPAAARPETPHRNAADRSYPSYHDTVPGVDVVIAARKALGQEARIEALFRGMGTKCYLTPSGVHRLVGGKSPLTSTRRAMTCLERNGVLVKTEHTTTGQYGRPEHAWRLNDGRRTP